VRRLFEKALSGIEFESGRPVLKAGSSIFLDQVVKVMRENPDYVLLISGHSDNVGKPEDNQQLSEARASSVKAYLEQQGIAGDRMMATGYGDTLPIATNDVAAGRAKNRRVELSVKFER
jgi:outer membrane protein OmpA-like peptidoglycan-associated protein